MNNIKLTKKNIGLIILMVLGLVVLPLTVLLSGRRTVLKQRATGGTGAMALKIINSTGQTNFLPRQSVTLNIVSSNPADQTVYNFAVKLDATNALVSSGSFTCAAPFKKLPSVATGWDFVCYKELGTLVENNTPLASFTITTAGAVGQGVVDFVTIPLVQGIKIIGEANGVVDLSGALADSTGFTFDVASILPSFPASGITSRPVVQPDATKCYYTVNVNWGSDQAGVALTQRIMAGTTVVRNEQVWCGAVGSYPAGTQVTDSVVSCAGWGNPGSEIGTTKGQVAYYKLYYKGVKVGVVDTRALCGGVVAPTVTVAPQATAAPTATLTPVPTATVTCARDGECKPLSGGIVCCSGQQYRDDMGCGITPSGQRLAGYRCGVASVATATPRVTAIPTPIPPSFGEISEWMNNADNSCKYTVAINWGGNKDNTSLTFQAVKNGVAGSETLMCGPITKVGLVIPTTGSTGCSNWENTFGGWAANGGSRVYRLYVGNNLVAFANKETQVCGAITTVIPTATATPTSNVAAPTPVPPSFGRPIPTTGPEPLSWCYYTLPVSLGSDKTRVSLTYKVDAGLEEYVWCGPLAAGYYRIRSAQTPMSCANWTNPVGQTKKDKTNTYFAYLGEEKRAEAVTDTCRIGTVTVTPTVTTSACPKKSIGDANCDNQINLIDFTIWKNEYLKLATTKSADFNNSGAVDLIDFTLWKNGYLAGN